MAYGANDTVIERNYGMTIFVWVNIGLQYVWIEMSFTTLLPLISGLFGIVFWPCIRCHLLY